MLKKLLFFALFSLLSFCAFAYDYSIREDLRRLDQTIAERPLYESQKRATIDSLMGIVYISFRPYESYQKIYEEYKSYNYDTAHIFAKKMAKEAQRMGDEQTQIEAAIANAFVYLSGGLFKEAYDVLQPLQNRYTQLPDEYHFTFARLLWDMADYAGGDAARQYDSLAVRHIEQMLSHVTEADSARYLYPLATIDLRQEQYNQSIARLHEALLDSRCSEHERAIYESSLAFAYYKIGQKDAALHHNIQAAIYDIRSSTYETVALRMVAEMLFEQGQTDLAERYIRMAMDDATRYHARHRQVSISQTLPIIEHQQTEELSRQRWIAFSLLGIVAVLFIISIVGMVLVIKRTRAVHEAQRTIHEMNQNLLVANKLKEEILGTFLTADSQYLTAVEQYQQRVKENVTQRRLNELMVIPKNADARIRRINMNHALDEMLLKLYPSFVTAFNNLLRPDQRFELKPNELLNTQMRIFALMRLGITHNDTIAEILDCSINTVYTYKTRTVLRSDLTPEAFYSALMSIPSFR